MLTRENREELRIVQLKVDAARQPTPIRRASKDLIARVAEVGLLVRRLASGRVAS